MLLVSEGFPKRPTCLVAQMLTDYEEDNASSQRLFSHLFARRIMMRAQRVSPPLTAASSTSGTTCPVILVNLVVLKSQFAGLGV